MKNAGRKRGVSGCEASRLTSLGCICPSMWRASDRWGPTVRHFAIKRSAPLPVRHPIAPHIPVVSFAIPVDLTYPSVDWAAERPLRSSLKHRPHDFSGHPTRLLATPPFLISCHAASTCGQSLPFVGGSQRTPTYPTSSQQKESKYERGKYSGYDKISPPSRI